MAEGGVIETRGVTHPWSSNPVWHLAGALQEHFNGAADRARTGDLLVDNQALFSSELQRHCLPTRAFARTGEVFAHGTGRCHETALAAPTPLGVHL